VDGGSGEEGQRPFVGKAKDPQEEVYDLECRDGLYSAVKVLGQEVPEDFGPEEPFDCGGDLVLRNVLASLSCWWQFWGQQVLLTGRGREDD
jgi:hypothetical protein